MSLGLWLAVVAYCLGLGTGWMIWRAAPKPGPADDQGDLGETDEPGADLLVDPMAAKLDALRAEIEAAKIRLDAEADENAVLSELIDGLEMAVKRSAARLNSVLYAVETTQTPKDAD